MSTHPDRKLIITFEQAEQPDLPEVGGKALNLWKLSHAGFNVPPGFTVSSAAYQSFLESNALIPLIEQELNEVDVADRQSIIHGSEIIQAMIMRAEIPQVLKEGIAQALQTDNMDEKFHAVRSSAASEDMAIASFAGQMDSYLYQKGTEQVCESIKSCWASAFTERVLLYRHNHNIPLFEKQMGVVVQEMIGGDISGVTFTANPVSGDWDCISISATYGLGDGIVSGTVSSDTYLYHRRNQSVETQIAQKEELTQFNTGENRGIEHVPVETDLQETAVFSETDLLTHIPVWDNIQTYYGYPQDIEWTILDNKLYILQSRPITTLTTWPGEPRLWDNSNIIESYSGVTTPLTFTFASEAYTTVYKQFCEIMGVSRSVIANNDDLFPNMIGLIRGRVYYNLISWYRMLALFPGFQYNKGFMELMMGVKEVERYTPTETESISFLKKWGVLFPRLLKLIFGLIYNLLRIESRIKSFDRNFQNIYGQHVNKDFDSHSVDALMALYLKLKRQLLFDWKPPLINDFYAMIFYGVLQKLVQKWLNDVSPTLQNDLLCGEGGLESTEPTHAIIHMAMLIRKDEDLTSWFLQQDKQEMMTALRAKEESSYKELYAAIEDYLSRYGYRCMEELKLESLSLRDDPEFLFTMISNYVLMEHLDLEAMQARERQIRIDAEREVARSLKGPRSWLKRRIFNWVLRNARRFVKNRENMRFNRTKIFGLVRDILNSVGRQLEAMRILTHARDIYYLELDEIIGFVNGTLSSPELGKLADLRKEVFQDFESEEPDEHFITYGPVWVGNQFLGEQKEDEYEYEEGVLRGVGCCPGVIHAPVKIVKNSRDNVDLKDHILVADRTDPGWVPLFPTAKGLLIERGSLLSHSAIVARELGIPTIVGVRDLLSTLENGQVVEMDGATGRIIYDGIDSHGED